MVVRRLKVYDATTNTWSYIAETAVRGDKGDKGDKGDTGAVPLVVQNDQPLVSQTLWVDPDDPAGDINIDCGAPDTTYGGTVNIDGGTI